MSEQSKFNPYEIGSYSELPSREKKNFKPIENGQDFVRESALSLEDAEAEADQMRDQNQERLGHNNYNQASNPEVQGSLLSNEIVKRAIEAVKEVNSDYWQMCLAQRAGNSPMAAGSIYPDMSPEELEGMLLTADWKPFQHPAIMEGCKAFRAELPGQLGIVSLASLPEDTVVTLDDRKNTGTVSAVVTGVPAEAAEFTVLIVGEEEGREIVFTFHPGDPIRPSLVEAANRHGEQITIAEALKLGLEMAKLSQ